MVEVAELGSLVEMIFIAALDSIKSGYNMTAGGEGMTDFSHSVEGRAKISKATIGRPKSVGMRQRLSASRIGQKYGPYSVEGCHNMSLARIGNQNRKGIPHSDEVRKRISEGVKRRRQLKFWSSRRKAQEIL